MTDRHSEAAEPDLIGDPELAARVESENALRQFDAAIDELSAWLGDPKYRLRPSVVLKLHRTLMERLSEYPGTYRPGHIQIRGSRHKPPPAGEVPHLVEEMCDYLNENWSSKSAIHLASYVLWRMNWIHPFSDGNGRTARIISYLILCAHSRGRLPGDLTIPEQIARNKQSYYDALEAADRGAERQIVDLSVMEDLLGGCLANQLYDFYKKAGGTDFGLDESSKRELEQVLKDARFEGVVDREAVFKAPAKKRKGLLGWIEDHPALVGLIGVVVAGLITAAIAIVFGK